MIWIGLDSLGMGSEGL